MAIDGQLFVVYANLAAYAFCFQMQQPVLPETVSNCASAAGWGRSTCFELCTIKH